MLYVKRKISNACAGGARPHVIAHSLGTYLTGTALSVFPDVQFRRVIYCGSALRCEFPWHELFHTRHAAFESVRNETGLKDRAIKLGGILGGIVPASGLGAAGREGFRSNVAGFIHNTTSPEYACPDCLAGNEAKVHNVLVEEFDHSHYFVGRGHAERFWLPALWGFEPSDFDQFQELCERIDDFRRKGHAKKRKLAEDELKDRSWSFTEKRTLREYMSEVAAAFIMERGKPAVSEQRVRQVVDWAVPMLCKAIVNARSAAKDASERRRDNVIRLLHPHLAVANCIMEIVEKLVQRGVL